MSELPKYGFLVMPQRPNPRDWAIWTKFMEAVGRNPSTVGLSPRRCAALSRINTYLLEMNEYYRLTGPGRTITASNNTTEVKEGANVTKNV